jgi:hypothetical protein
MNDEHWQRAPWPLVPRIVWTSSKSASLTGWTMIAMGPESQIRDDPA